MQQNKKDKKITEAAEYAASQLPVLEQSRAQLDKRIASLRAVITAWQELSGEESALNETFIPARTASKRAYPYRRNPPGQARQHIVQILSKGEFHTIASLMEQLKEIFGIDYPRSTVSVILKQGIAQGTLIKERDKWGIKTEDAWHPDEGSLFDSRYPAQEEREGAPKRE